MVTDPDKGAVQFAGLLLVMLTSVSVVVDVNAIVAETVPVELSGTVRFGPPLTVYVMTEFGVPVKVTVALPPEHTVVALVAIVAVGVGRTVICMKSLAGAVHDAGAGDVTLINWKIVLPVYAFVIVAVPEEFSVIVWLAPPLTL
jgi:hypothetical protein